MITLYDISTASSPRRTCILLAEKALAHETIQVDLRTNEQLSEAYRKINPLCTVPALHTDEGLLLTDNAAIAAYLDARYPQPPLLGVTPAERTEVASWNLRIEFEGLIAIAEAMRNSAPSLASRALPGPVDYPQIRELGALPRRLAISFSQGAEWKALISRYIGTIPLRDDGSCAPAQIIAISPPPRTPVSSAMIAKLGAAARPSQSAAPRVVAVHLS